APGECGFVASIWRSWSSRWSVRQTCAHPRNTRCSPVKPSMTGAGCPSSDRLYASRPRRIPPRSPMFSPIVSRPMMCWPGSCGKLYDSYCVPSFVACASNFAASVAVPLELRGADGVPHEVSLTDHESRIVPPLRGVADLDAELRKLLERARLRFGSHPLQVLDPTLHRGEQVCDELLHLRFRLGREVLRDVRAADRLAHPVFRRVDSALPARTLSFGTVQELRPELPVRVDEALRKERRRFVGDVERFPSLQR